jgi:hypothetical protein
MMNLPVTFKLIDFVGCATLSRAIAVPSRFLPLATLAIFAGRTTLDGKDRLFHSDVRIVKTFPNPCCRKEESCWYLD